MRILILTAVFAFGITLSGLAQDVRVVLKSGETKTEELQAFSGTKLFLKNGPLEISSLESIAFASEDAINKNLKNHLIQAGVKIVFSDDLIKPEALAKSDYPKQDDHIIVLTCQDSASALFKRIGKHLLLKGYAIDYSSNELRVIKTGFRATSRLRYNYYLNIVVVSNQVIITSQWKITRGNLACWRRSGIFDWHFCYKKMNFKHRVGQVLHADVMKKLEDFDRIRIDYR